MATHKTCCTYTVYVRTSVHSVWNEGKGESLFNFFVKHSESVYTTRREKIFKVLAIKKGSEKVSYPSVRKFLHECTTVRTVLCARESGLLCLQSYVGGRGRKRGVKKKGRFHSVRTCTTESPFTLCDETMMWHQPHSNLVIFNNELGQLKTKSGRSLL